MHATYCTIVTVREIMSSFKTPKLTNHDQLICHGSTGALPRPRARKQTKDRVVNNKLYSLCFASPSRKINLYLFQLIKDVYRMDR